MCNVSRVYIGGVGGCAAYLSVPEKTVCGTYSQVSSQRKAAPYGVFLATTHMGFCIRYIILRVLQTQFVVGSAKPTPDESQLLFETLPTLFCHLKLWF